MKLLVAIILTALLSFVGGLYLPWWSIAIAAFVSVLLIPLASGRAFLAGFSGVFLLWFLLALWIDVKNQHILSKRSLRYFPLVVHRCHYSCHCIYRRISGGIGSVEWKLFEKEIGRASSPFLFSKGEEAVL